MKNAINGYWRNEIGGRVFLYFDGCLHCLTGPAMYTPNHPKASKLYFVSGSMINIHALFRNMLQLMYNRKYIDDYRSNSS